jgi:hypothetical protein
MEQQRMTVVEYHSVAWALLVEIGWITAWVDGNIATMLWDAVEMKRRRMIY